MSIGGILNLIELGERLVLSGKTTERQFHSDRATGYEVVVDLAPSLGENALPNEARLLADLGLEYHHIPVNWTSPESSQFEPLTAITEKAADRRIAVRRYIARRTFE